MKSERFMLLLAGAFGLTLSLPAHDGGADNPIPMPRAKPTVVAQAPSGRVGRMRIGGLRICLPENMASARVREIDTSGNTIGARFNDGSVVSVANDDAVLRSLADAVAEDRDDCIEVSFDPVDRFGVNRYASDGMGGTIVADRMLALDAELDGLYKGTYPLSERQLGSASLPQEQARQLLSPEHNVSDFRELVYHYPSPPIVDHMTTMRVEGFDGKSVAWDVHLSPSFESPTGEKLYATAAEEMSAVLPYLPLIQRFESAPPEFESTLSEFRQVLNIARTYTLLASCQKQRTRACRRLFKDIARRPEDAGDDSVVTMTDWTEAWSRAKDEHLSKVWQEYRDTIMERTRMDRDQRIAFAVDEALTRYRDARAAQKQSRRRGITPQAVLAMTSGLDLEEARYGGWGYLARFLAMVWGDASLVDTMDELKRAYERALASDDGHLRYQVLRSARELMPVIASKVFVSEKSDIPEGTPPFDPAGQLRGRESMEPRAYLAYLDKTIDGLIKEHIRAQFQLLSKRVAAQLNGNLSRLRVKDAQRLLLDFQRSHISGERVAIEEDLYAFVASLYYLVGVAAVNENDRSLARNHLRMLRSLRAVKNRREARRTESARRANKSGRKKAEKSVPVRDSIKPKIRDLTRRLRQR